MFPDYFVVHTNERPSVAVSCHVVSSLSTVYAQFCRFTLFSALLNLLFLLTQRPAIARTFTALCIPFAFLISIITYVHGNLTLWPNRPSYFKLTSPRSVRISSFPTRPLHLAPSCLVRTVFIRHS